MGRNQHANSGNGTTARTTKQYLRITAGPLRFQYVHRIVAAAMIGRELTKADEVHHKNQNKLDPSHTNLFILGANDHGWVSARQAYFMRNKDAKEKAIWDAFMEAQYAEQKRQIEASKNHGKPFVYQDGKLEQAWGAAQ